MSAGDALADLRQDVDTANRWWYWKNYLTFNLYGDPALGIDSHALPEEMMPDADAGVPPADVDMGVPEDDMGMADADAGGLDADVPSPTHPDWMQTRPKAIPVLSRARTPRLPPKLTVRLPMPLAAPSQPIHGSPWTQAKPRMRPMRAP